jgi:predicted AlkP superfamily pyrophosphatase or phosphodiesterase
MKNSLRALVCLLAAALLAASCATPPPAALDAAGKPRLLVLIVVDGLPQRQVVDYRDQLAPDGLRRFLDRGAWFSEAHHGHAFTATAAGHVTIFTGAYPHRSGIIANEWRDPATGQVEYCAGDVSATYIGHQTRKLDGTSPKNLRVETVGDVLKRSDARSKVIGIAGKDRGAILPAGRRGTAYMYQAQTGQFASSTFYMQDHPRWVKDFNAAKPADAYFHREWKPLLAETAYAKSLPDEQKWYGKGGKLPKTLGDGQDKPGPLFYGAIIPSPFGDELTLDFARAAIAGEQLGSDDAPDILSVSLSGHDYINHAYGAESRLSHDHVLQIDRLLQGFFRDLDATVGKERYVAMLTSDHGFMPSPEYSQSVGRTSGRQVGSQTLARVNAALSSKYGEGKWVLYVSAQGLVFNRPLIAQKQVDAAAFVEEARRVLLSEPGIAVAYTRAELESGSRAGAPYFEAIGRTWNRDLSGDLQFIMKPYWMMSSSGNMTTHGSPHPYDTHVPLLFYGPKWVKPGHIDTRVEIVDIAPTLSAMLGVPPPSASEGKPLPLKAPGS